MIRMGSGLLFLVFVLPNQERVNSPSVSEGRTAQLWPSPTLGLLPLAVSGSLNRTINNKPKTHKLEPGNNEPEALDPRRWFRFVSFPG